MEHLPDYPDACIVHEDAPADTLLAHLPAAERRILVVAPRPAELVLLEEVLQDMGEIHAVSTATQALDLIAQKTFALTILIPGPSPQDDFSACRALRQSFADLDLPILLVTMAHEPQLEVQAFTAGCNDFIGLPVHPTILRARVAQSLQIQAQSRARRRVEEQLRLSEERHRLIAENADDVIWTMGVDGRFTYVSPSVVRLRGFSAAEVMTQSWAEIFPPKSLSVVQSQCQDFLGRLQRGEPLQPVQLEVMQICRDGTLVWTDVLASALIGLDGQFKEILGVTRNIDARKRAELDLRQARDHTEQINRALQAANAELQRLATTDDLTGVWNRRHFQKAVATEIERVARYGASLSLVLFDIDRFKVINDTHGHLVGDQVLITLSQRVRDHLRDVDVLARWGGEEFVVMLPHCEETQARQLAEKLRVLIAADPFPGVGKVTSSFGIAQYRPPESTDAWFTRADDALYQAKRTGRNRVAWGQ